MTQELYTKLFVNIEMTHDELLRFVARLFGGDIEMWTVVCRSLDFDVRPNDDVDIQVLDSALDEFIRFPFTIEVASTTDITLEDYLAAIARLMIEIETKSGSVVAACDWEDMLPGEGRLGLDKH